MTDTLPIPLDVRSGGVHRDYAAIFNDLVRIAPVLLPEWTYMGQDDFGVAMLGLLSYTADHIKYDADRVEREISLAGTVSKLQRVAPGHASRMGEWVAMMN